MTLYYGVDNHCWSYRLVLVIESEGALDSLSFLQLGHTIEKDAGIELLAVQYRYGIAFPLF